jgi:thiamine-phosphate pyrophosphorylase
MILSDEAIRLWETAKALNRQAARVSPPAGRLPPLIFMTDPERTPRPWEVAARLPAGAAVIHRGFGRPEAADEAARLREVTHKADVRLLIGLDIGLAVAVGADGVHFPERALDHVRVARTANLPLVTVATHSAAALSRACEAGADAAILSPVFVTRSGSGGEPLGPEGFQRLAEQAAIPVYALGGVTDGNVATLSDIRACGVCAIDGVVTAFGSSRN